MLSVAAGGASWSMDLLGGAPLPDTRRSNPLWCAGNQWVEWGWRLSLGLAAVPAVVLTLGGLVLPESPSSLIERCAVLLPLSLLLSSQHPGDASNSSYISALPFCTR